MEHMKHKKHDKHDKHDKAKIKKGLKSRNNQKYKTRLCENNMSFADCELAILRHAVDKSEEIQGEKTVSSPEVQKMIGILEEFLIRKKLICYGGTAINAILPSYDKFYNTRIEIPDYDFFSKNALDDAKELADIYYKAGYNDVEAKAGMHHNTFKVFVNFIGIADITFLEPVIYDSIQKEAIMVAGIKYAPPNYLRMSMYLELSRPQGDVTRWEKVLKRLTLLNKHFPLTVEKPCDDNEFMRKMYNRKIDSFAIHDIVRDSLIDQGVVFFGGYAASIYGRYMPDKEKRLIDKIPDFDVIHKMPEKCASIVIEQLKEHGFHSIHVVEHDNIGEIVPKHVEILVGEDTVAFIYEPIACHNYNVVEIDKKEIQVATIDTMLSFYLAFIYAQKTYFSISRILCMAKFLFEVQSKNRLEQRGILKRFSLQCYGKQPILEEIRAEKSQKFKELKQGTREYESWFLRYDPANKTRKKGLKKVKKVKTEKNTNTNINKNKNKTIKLLNFLKGK